MADTAFQALTRALHQRAIATSQPWAERAYPDFAPATAEKPYLIFFWMGGGEANWRKTADADILMGIKVVATMQSSAFAGAAAIAALFNDSGTQDIGATSMDGGSNWEITTVTQGMIIHMLEPVSGATFLYHEGSKYSFHLEPT